MLNLQKIEDKYPKETFDWSVVEAEIQKMEEWISKHPKRKLSDAFALNWLAKTEIPPPKPTVQLFKIIYT